MQEGPWTIQGKARGGDKVLRAGGLQMERVSIRDGNRLRLQSSPSFEKIGIMGGDKNSLLYGEGEKGGEGKMFQKGSQWDAYVLGDGNGAAST